MPQASDSLIISFGEVLIDFVPTVSGVSLAEAPAFKKAAGGAPANVAVGIARLGGKAAFVGKTGEDEFGHMLADLLKVCAADDASFPSTIPFSLEAGQIWVRVSEQAKQGQLPNYAETRDKRVCVPVSR